MLLAEHTSEAIRIEVRDGFVFKYLRSPDSFRETSGETRRRQIRLRVIESHRWPEFNPCVLDESANCLISPYLTGRLPTRQELYSLRQHFIATGRAYIEDLGRNNVLIVDGSPIVIDFHINETHPDFLRFLPGVLP